MPDVSARSGPHQSPPPVLPMAIHGQKEATLTQPSEGVRIGRENRPSGGHNCARSHSRSADQRRAVRQERTKPLVVDLKAWLEECLARLSGKSVLAGAILYALNQWDGLVRFLEDGRIELDTNAVERSIGRIDLSTALVS